MSLSLSSTKINTPSVYLPVLPVNTTEAVDKAYVDALGDTYGSNFFSVTESYPYNVTTLKVTDVYQSNGYNPTAGGATLTSSPTNIWRRFNSIQFSSNAFAALCATANSYSFIQLQPGTYHIEAGASLQRAGTHCTTLLAYGNSPGYITEIFTNTTAGSNTWTVPANVTSVSITVVGGGGGGGGSTETQSGGGGGGGGTTTVPNFTVTPGSTFNIIVGAGGTPQNNGSPSFFGSISAGGGFAGGTATSVGGATRGGNAGSYGTKNGNTITYTAGLTGGLPVGNYSGAGAGYRQVGGSGTLVNPGVYPLLTLTGGYGYYSPDLGTIVGAGGGSALYPTTVPSSYNGFIVSNNNYGYGGNGRSNQALGQSGGQGVVVLSYSVPVYSDYSQVPFQRKSGDYWGWVYPLAGATDGIYFGTAKWNNSDNDIPPGWYRVYYLSGASYVGGWRANSNLTYSKGQKSQTTITIGAANPNRATGNTVADYYTYMTYLTNWNGTGKPWYTDFYHAGGTMEMTTPGAYDAFAFQAPFPVYGYGTYPTGGYGTPMYPATTFRLQPIEIPIVPGINTIATGSIGYSNNVAGAILTTPFSNSTSYLTTRVTFDKVTNIALAHVYDGGDTSGNTTLGAIPYGALSNALPAWLGSLQPNSTTAWMNIWQISPSTIYTDLANATGDDRIGTDLIPVL